jgi:hypothetical protein
MLSLVLVYASFRALARGRHRRTVVHFVPYFALLSVFDVDSIGISINVRMQA